MSELAPEIKEVLLLASQMLDGALPEEGMARLEAILGENPEVRRWYGRFVCLHAILQWRAGVVETAISIDDEWERPSDFSDAMILPAVHEPEELEKEEENENEERLANACDLTMLPLLLKPPVVTREPRRDRKAFLRWMRSAALAASILIALSLSAAVAIHWGLLRPGMFKPAPPPTVATLTASDNLQWETGFAPGPRGSDIEAGRQLALVSGRIELAFAGGASVVIEAPARFSADSPGTMTLASGRMAAVVPVQARGFTVTAAGITVKDLGTEFGLRCDKWSGTEIDVFKGKVEARTTTGATQGPTTTLVAGNAAKLSGDALATVPSGADAGKFPRHFQGINLPPSFSDVDVGGPASAGAARYSAGDGTWTMTAVGLDTWFDSDQFNTAFEKLEGDATITCRLVTATTEADGSRRKNSKAGIMMRASLDPGSQFVEIVRTESLGIQLVLRDESDEDATVVGPYRSPMLAPVWLKLSRVGKVFVGSYSKDGITWTTLGTQEMDLPPTMYAGLIVTAGDETHVGTATIANLTVVSKPPAK